jgi:transposase
VEEALPKALVVADHFHLVRLANTALTQVRQRVTRQTTGGRGLAKDPVWANRRKLLRAREHLSDQAGSPGT